MDGRNTRHRLAGPTVAAPQSPVLHSPLQAAPLAALQAAPLAAPPASRRPTTGNLDSHPAVPGVPTPEPQASVPPSVRPPAAAIIQTAPVPTQPADAASTTGAGPGDAAIVREPVIAAPSQPYVGGRWSSPQRPAAHNRWSPPPAAAKRPPPSRPPDHEKAAQRGSASGSGTQPLISGLVPSHTPLSSAPIPAPPANGSRRPPTPPPPVPIEVTLMPRPAIAGDAPPGQGIRPPPIDPANAESDRGQGQQLAEHSEATRMPRPAIAGDVTPGARHTPLAPRPTDGDAVEQAARANGILNRHSDLPPAAMPPGSMSPGIPDSMATALDTPATPTLTPTFPETVLEGWPLT